MNILVSLISGLAGILFLTFICSIPIIIIWLLTHLSKKSSQKQKNLIFSIVLIVIGFLSLVGVGISFAAKIASQYTIDPLVEANGFTIEKYNVKLNVNENNVVDVTEQITVDFFESGHYGIYKFIPTWLQYTGKDGKTLSRKSMIKNLQANDEEYSVEDVGDEEQIKIGSPDYTLPVGLKTYTLTYQYDMGFDPYEGFDEFIFHNFGDYWGTEINNASVEITMPKAIDENSIKFFSDKYRKNDISSYVDYYVNGNTIYAQLSSDFDLYKALTIDIELPEGYFVNTNDNYTSYSIIVCLLIILFLIITIIKWFIHGKNYDKCPETVEFYAPEGYDAASIGYIYKKDYGRNLAISTIIELANKGFIKIDESEDKKRIKITNLCPIDINKEINREITITKLKDAEKASDQKIMNKLFDNNSVSAIITDNFNAFYANTKKLVAKGYIRIDSDSIEGYDKEYLDSLAKQISAEVFAGKPAMTANEKIVFEQLFANGDINIITKDIKFYLVFYELIENLKIELDDKINDPISYKNMAVTSTLFNLGSIYFYCGYIILNDLDPKFNILYLLTFISLIIIFILTILMKRKSSYGEQITAKIKGFKKYLETVEKEQLNQLVSENPNYFFDILPYAYVLRVSKSWIDKFENIPIPNHVPNHDMGNFNYWDINSLNNLAASVNYPSYLPNSSCKDDDSW